MLTDAEHQTARKMLADIRATLGDVDPFRAVWDGSDEPTRRELARLGAVPLYLSGDKWRDIPASYRGQIKARAASLRDWLVKVLPA